LGFRVWGFGLGDNLCFLMQLPQLPPERLLAAGEELIFGFRV